MTTKRFTISTESGKANSLKRPVTIAWTITPIESGQTAHPFNPAVGESTTFDINSARTVHAQWSSTLVISVLRRDRDQLIIPQVLLRGMDGKRQQSYPRQLWTLPNEFGTLSVLYPARSYPHHRAPIQPGCSATMTPSDGWSHPITSTEVDQTSLKVTNNSGSKRTIAMLRRSPSFVVFHSLESGHAIVAASNWQFQAYVMDDPITSGFTILQSEDLTRPIFDTPISCDALPTNSTWILCQDDNGVIRLKNELYSHLGYPPVTPDRAIKAPVEEKSPLSEVLERLGIVEQSITRMQDDYAQGQKAMAEIRNQLTALEKSAVVRQEEVQECRAAISDQRSDFNHGISVVEARAATLAGSFDQNQNRLSLVQKALADTQHLLSGVEKSTKDQFRDLNRRLPIVESKVDKGATSHAHSHERLSALEETAERTRKQITAVEKTVHQTQDQVSVVQQLVLAKQTPAPAALHASTFPLQGQPVNQDNHAVAVQGRLEKLEKLTQEHRKALRVLDRRLPDMEGRTERLEVDLSAVQLSVAGLGRRVNVIEMSSGDDGGTGDSSSSSAAVSPVMFPVHLADSPLPS